MWNVMQNMGPNYTQKRGYHGMNVSNMPIIENKSFVNPNFVNKNHPSLHSTETSDSDIMPKPDFYQSNADSKNVSVVGSIQNENSSPIIEKIMESHPEMIEENGRKSRNGKRKLVKSSSQNNADYKDMDVEFLDTCDSSFEEEPVEETPELTMEVTYDEGVDEVDCSITTFTIAFPTCNRERQVSLCESEDSFIVFESGGEDNDDDDFDDTSDTGSETSSESESEEEDVESDSSVIPNKRVRFADESVLCEVHPMVQWSFAYQAARKGHWQEFARDRDRFNKRINRTGEQLSLIFDPEHRQKIYEERFEH